MSAAQFSRPPELDLDPFSCEFLADPYPGHATLRDAGPIVRLSRYGIWAAARHAEVSAILQDWQTFCSGRGGGLSDFAKDKPWRPPSIILEADPPLHTRTRAVLSKVLSRPALMRLREDMQRQAEALIAEVLADSRIDAVPRLAQAFPLRVFPDALGIAPEGRENLLPYGEMAFNAFGPRNAVFEASMLKAAEVTAWITAQCRRDALADNGFGAQIYAEADRGAISEEEAGLLVRSLLTAGLDTTIQGLAHALHCFALWPDQWQAIRQDPSLIRNAFEEVIRHTSPVQTFFRTTTRETNVAGTPVPEGEKVLLFLAAANRDPRHWLEPDRFDVHRDTTGHVGFGHGIHQCVGQMVARLEAEILIDALARRVSRFELDGSPVFRPNNTLRSLERLPLRTDLGVVVHRAARAEAAMLELRVARKRPEAQDICSIELIDPSGRKLPQFTAGAHIDVEIRGGLTRQYSLCDDPSERHRYLIAVLRESVSRGCSKALHEEVQEGQLLRVSGPKNRFPLVEGAPRSLLIAGGIGITPILAMAIHLARAGAEFEMHYCTRSLERTAFLGRIQRSSFASRVHVHLGDGPPEQRLDITKLLDAPAGAHLYVCGPRRLMDFVLSAARASGWPESRLHYELFAAEVLHTDSDRDFDVELASSRRVIRVCSDQTVAAALLAAGVRLPLSCEQGVCGTCLTGVLAGIPDHRDSYLTADERATNRSFTPCCSRARSPRLVLDL